MKLTKVLLGSSLAISAVAIPSTLLTSCSNSWGKLTPFMIGSTNSAYNDTPYANFVGSTFYDVDGQNMTNYLQTNYAVHTAKGLNYAYSSPMKFVDDETKEDKWVNGSSGWYVSSDAAFNATAVDKKGEESKNVTNARNSALAANIDFIDTIGTTINNYLTLALSYQASQLKAPEKGETLDEADLKAAWGESFALDHGGSAGDIARKFYEFQFALSNLNGSDTTNALLKTSNVGFNLLNFPIPSYKWENNAKVNLSDEFLKLLEGQTATSWKELKYYTSKTDVQKDADENEYVTYTYEAVPVKIRVKSLEERYLNTTINTDSFLVNDYYSSNDDITGKVSDIWKKQLPKFVTDLKEEDVAPIFKSFTLQTNDNAAGINLPGTKDERLSDLKGDEFVALIKYSVNIYSADDKQNKNTATISGLSNLFPAFLLDSNQYPDLYKSAHDDSAEKIIDSDKVNEKTNKLLNLINIANTSTTKTHASKLDEESKKLLSFLGYMFAASDKTLNADQIIKTLKI